MSYKAISLVWHYRENSWLSNLGSVSFMGWSQILLEDIDPSIGYAVYPRFNNGLKSLNIGIFIDSKALWKKWGGMMCPSLLTTLKTITCWKLHAHNSWNFSGVCNIATFWSWSKFFSLEKNKTLLFFWVLQSA